MDRISELENRFANEPLGKALGASLEFLEKGKAVVKLKARGDFLIVGGIVQGGITTVLADFAGVYAAMSQIPEGHTPAEHIAIDFFHPIRNEVILFASAKVFQETRGSIWTNVEIFGIDGEKYAFARIHFIKPK